MRLALLAACAATCLAIVAPVAGAATDPPPVADYFRRPQLSGFQLSPNGKYLGAIVQVGERRNLAVMDLETRKSATITALKKQDVRGYVWASDDRLLFFLDNDGNEANGIFAVNRDGSDAKILIEPPELQIKDGSYEVLTANVISLMEDDPRHVLVAVSRATPRTVVEDVQVLDIYTGTLRMKVHNPGDVVGWLADRKGTVFGAVQVKELDTIFLYRTSDGGEWQEWSRMRAGEHGWMPAWRSEDAKRWYVASTVTPDGQPRDTTAVYGFDPTTRKLGSLVYESPGYDVGNVIASRATDDIIGVGLAREVPEQRFFDAWWARLQGQLGQSYPNRTVTLTSVSNDERRAIFLVSSSDDPGTYFLFDSEKNTFEELAKLMPWLERPKLGRAKPITLKARDGLELHGYLTLPAAGPQRGLPLVLMPHGGPRGRDFGTFDPLVQLMASRGYGVLQVNFRGSVGYGLAFDKAGWREWGGKMQDDLTDAVRWSVSQGIADPSRICVFGASYGGYAAMMGLAATPELFRCGVDYVGVTDINLLLRTIPRAWETARAELNLQIGDPKADKDLLAARSPVNLAQNIRVPVLMAYGKRDPRVVFQHATRFEDALQRAKVPYELIVKTNEGHGYAKFENQVEFGTRLVEFLGKYIGPATAAAPAATTGGR